MDMSNMTEQSKRRLIVPYPSTLFLLIITIFTLFPTIVITLTQYTPQRSVLLSEVFEVIKWKYFWGVILFYFTFSITLMVLITFYEKKMMTYRSIQLSASRLQSSYRKNRLGLYFLVIFCLFAISAHALNGGLAKLDALGSDMDGRTFRYKGFDDMQRIYLILLAVARRFILPLLILYLGILRRFDVKVSFLFYSMLVCLQLFACSLTFARAPFLTLLLVIVIPNLLLGSKIRRISYLFITLISVIFIAGVVTNLQYNITQFSVFDAVGMGWNFLHNRMLFVPNVVPIHDAFSIIPTTADPLYLRFSRLGALFGASAVGTETNLSVFVSPVGYVGDVYRNFHYFGLVVFSVFTGILFFWLDNKFKQLGALQVVFLFFSLLALIFYWIMGVVFSMGAVFAFGLVLVLSFKYRRAGNKHD